MGGVQLPASQLRICTGLRAAYGSICTLTCMTQPLWLHKVWAQVRLLVQDLCVGSSQKAVLVLTHIIHPLSVQTVIRTEQCFSSPQPLLFFLPVTGLPGQMSLSGSDKHVLLCLASVASYWSWGRGCVTVVPGSRPWVSLLILQVLLGLSSSTLNDRWKHSWQRRTRGLQSKSSALLPEAKPYPFLLILQGHSVLEGVALWWDSLLWRHCFPWPKFVLNLSCPSTFLPMALFVRLKGICLILVL